MKKLTVKNFYHIQSTENFDTYAIFIHAEVNNQIKRITAQVVYVNSLNIWYINQVQDRLGQRNFDPIKKEILEASVQHIKDHSKQRLKYLFITGDVLKY